jgi:hypothetical protein
MDKELIIANYIESDVQDIVVDLKNYTDLEVSEFKRYLLSDVIGDNHNSPDYWLVKLLDKEIKLRK